MKPTVTAESQSPPSLTKREAEERAALISVNRYDIDVDVTDMLAGSDFRATSTVSFKCRKPGASTFVDAAFDVISVTLNGAPVSRDAITNGRITLDNLQADNVLVVESVQHETAAGEWVHRSVDKSDGEVYVWTSFEPDDARRAWACFDQPDLKAPHRFTVLAPARWIVVSNSGDPRVEPVFAKQTPPGDAKRWSFPDTPPLSTYVPVLTAGPYYELRSERGGFDLGLFSRQSLSKFLDRDADELFEVTAQGLAFFGENFGLPFPQKKYDQLFVPDMGGAMENHGCVLWSDAFVYRSDPTYLDRERRAIVLLHEMAHMWFGDMVTMRWWEDIWLNEAFAEWACYWSAEGATKFTDAWAGFAAGGKLWGYSADMSPTTHPIRQPVDDVAGAAASFDGITYPKGASVLKQLFVYVGTDAFVAGLKSYFAKHAWGNTELSDLMDELSTASGRDLSAWTKGWLDTAGTDRLELETTDDGAVLRATGPNGAEPRPHRVVIGVYDRDGEQMFRTAALSIETTGAETPVSGVGDAPLMLVNDDDLTFASVRPFAESLDTMLADAGKLPTAISRAVAFTTAWNMLVHGDLRSEEFVRCVLGVLRTESVESIIEPAFDLAVEAADYWSPDNDRDRLMADVADLAVELARDPARRKVALRALAQTAVTDAHFAVLASAVGDDVDLAWRTFVRRADVREIEHSEIEALQARDPDPDSWVRVLAVNAARPETSGKDTAWKAIIDEHRVPFGAVRGVARAFWRRSQPELALPYAEKYLQLLPQLDDFGMIPALTVSGGLFPASIAAESFIARATAAANDAKVSAIVRRTVIEACDKLARRLRARRL
ncbi:MAG: aminopeptidase N [Chloroflexota bacterium]